MLLCLVVCLTFLASFFLPSASLINICMYTCVIMSLHILKLSHILCCCRRGCSDSYSSTAGQNVQRCQPVCIGRKMFCLSVNNIIFTSRSKFKIYRYNIYYYIHVLMRDEKEGRKKQARSTNNKAKQHSTPKAVTFPKKNERH